MINLVEEIGFVNVSVVASRLGWLGLEVEGVRSG